MISIRLKHLSWGGINKKVNSGTGTLRSSRNESKSASTTYNNSVIKGNNISITSQQDTNIKGANVEARDDLNVDVGGNLNVASVQDRHTSSNKGMGISGGLSLSGGEVPTENGKTGGIIKNNDGNAGNLTGASGGLNASNGRTSSKETILTTLTSGNTADINVGGNTDVKGALIATVDESGKDLGNLNLETETLTFADLSNTKYTQNQSAGINTSVGTKGGEIDSTYNTTSLQYLNESGYSNSKTLATVGQGNLTITDTENSHDTTALNRDAEHTEKDLFTVDRKQGDIDVTVDHRLLTEEGRNQIAEDILITDMFRESLERAITTDRVGIEDVFTETGKQLDVYNAVKQSIVDDPSLAVKLQDPDLTPEGKQQMLDQLTHAAIKSLGYDSEGYENKIIAKDDDVRQGYYSEETKDSYINDATIDDTEGLVNVAGHEMSHAIDDQSGDVNKYSEQDRETYAENIGEDFVDYTDTALGVNGHGSMASTNNHVGNTSSTVVNNTHEYNGLDKSKGDNFVPAIVAVPATITAISAAIANPEVQKVTKQALADAMEGVEEVGKGILSLFEPDAKFTDAELDIAAKAYNQMKEYRDTSTNSDDFLAMDNQMKNISPDVIARANAMSAGKDTVSMPGGSEIPDPLPMPGGSEIEESKVVIITTPEADRIDSTTTTTVTDEQGIGKTESRADTGVDPLLVVDSRGRANPDVADFEASLTYLPPGERVALVKDKVSAIAVEQGWKKDNKLSKINNRQVYRTSDGEVFSLDSQHGRLEKINPKNGKHLGEYDIYGQEQTKPADNSGEHNLKVK